MYVCMYVCVCVGGGRIQCCMSRRATETGEKAMAREFEPSTMVRKLSVVERG